MKYAKIMCVLLSTAVITMSVCSVSVPVYAVESAESEEVIETELMDTEEQEMSEESEEPEIPPVEPAEPEALPSQTTSKVLGREEKYSASIPFIAIGDRVCYNVELPMEGIPSFITQEMK